ncbi:hypothetical protein NBRC116188_17190 [Oceaniserpentilla sp. 4NH20-0058]|uniref:hypothetical protein n=1 Tax=Oceaniserpentilla sp. 4NH20-0058 TaxID=3127660 RepID=UPI0031098650
MSHLHCILFTLVLSMVSTDLFALNNQRNQNYIGANLEIKPNAITQLKLPVNSLKGSQLATNQGITIQFKNKGSIDIHTLQANKLEFGETDLRQFPLYIMGLKPFDLESDTIKDKIIKEKNAYQAVKIASFRTENGDGYLIIGNGKSVIYLTDKENESIITKIHIETMSEFDINNLIIKGLI